MSAWHGATTRQRAADRLVRAATRSDVPGRLDAALGTAAEVVGGAVERLPGRLTRRLPGRRGPDRRLPLALAGIAVGVLAAIGVAAWSRHRRAVRSASRDLVVDERTFDREALDRAADEGMTPSAADGGGSAPASNGVVHDTIGDLV